MRLCVTGVASLSALIYNVVLFGGVGGVRDPSFLVEDADLLNTRLGSCGLDRAVQPFPVIAQHVVGGALPDDVADAFSRLKSVLLQMLAVQPNITISE